MAILVVGGTHRGAGKTTLICALIAALREFRWTAVKITLHAHDAGNPLACHPERVRRGERVEGPAFSFLAENVGYDERGPSDPSPLSIWEETEPGQGTDTARYLAAGAHRAFLMTAPEAEPSIAPLYEVLEPGANLIFESNRVLRNVEPDLCLAVLGPPHADSKPSFAPLLLRADAIVAAPGANIARLPMPPRALLFGLPSLERIPPGMLTWLHTRLNLHQFHRPLTTDH